jgi:aflatoxin B1 aldehyde reductase
MRFPTPRLYLGTMTFGWSQSSSKVDTAIATEMVRHFLTTDIDSSLAGHDGAKLHYVDTARIYAGGKTETILGEVLMALDPAERNSIVLGSKAHPSQKGGLTPQGIQDQFAASLDAMKVSSVGEYYLHQPDPESSLLESLQCADGMVKSGKACCIGMSNYHASEMERAFMLCEEHGLTKPSVFQGLYNPLNRAVESELLPVLRKHNCAFIAYNPLAAGLLTGKHVKGEDDKVMKGRFKNNPNYLPRFYTEANFEAVEIVRRACDDAGISLVEATFKWLLRHSALTKDDGVLLGASSMAQLEQNMAACNAAAADEEGGQLDDAVVQAFDKAWEITNEAGVFPYWRSYSADMPNGASLDQGASYSAAKK